MIGCGISGCGSSLGSASLCMRVFVCACVSIYVCVCVNKPHNTSLQTLDLYSKKNQHICKYIKYKVLVLNERIHSDYQKIFYTKLLGWPGLEEKSSI